MTVRERARARESERVAYRGQYPRWTGRCRARTPSGSIPNDLAHRDQRAPPPPGPCAAGRPTRRRRGSTLRSAGWNSTAPACRQRLRPRRMPLSESYRRERTSRPGYLGVQVHRRARGSMPRTLVRRQSRCAASRSCTSTGLRRDRFEDATRLPRTSRLTLPKLQLPLQCTPRAGSTPRSPRAPCPLPPTWP